MSDAIRKGLTVQAHNQARAHRVRARQLKSRRAVGSTLPLRIRDQRRDATMATMVSAPYVNHIPTMTGGVGHDQLKRFYKYHFLRCESSRFSAYAY